MIFQQWTPTDNLGNAYDVENIIWGSTISFTLVAEKKRAEQDTIQRFRLEWSSSDIIACNVTDETYREDCWDLDFENNGRFYTSNDSGYIEVFRKKSPLFPENAIHFLIVGTNTIIDVLAKAYPTISMTD